MMYFIKEKGINYLRLEEIPNQGTFCKIRTENDICRLVAMIIL